MATPHPATHIKWRKVTSSNVAKVGWLPEDYAPAMFVVYKSGTVYCYVGVTRQRTIAAARAKSVGEYINRVVKPKFKAIKVSGL